MLLLLLRGFFLEFRISILGIYTLYHRRGLHLLTILILESGALRLTRIWTGRQPYNPLVTKYIIMIVLITGSR
jgi:hypothetical protein